MTDRDIIKNAFKRYTDKYDPSDIKISLKIDHTYRVAELSEIIARNLELDEKDIFLAFTIGMLHDIGRFEQVRTYGTFVDAESVDHAEFGANLLFHDGLINEFLDEDDLKQPEVCHFIETSIRQHNKLAISSGLTLTETLFCNILRDADKIDIFRVIAEVRYEDSKNKPIEALHDGARDSIMQCVYENRCVPRGGRVTRFEKWVQKCCMAFELVYPISKKITKEQKYLTRILDYKPENETECEQVAIVQKELAYYL